MVISWSSVVILSTVWSRAPVAVVIPLDVARLKHLAEDSFSLIVLLRESLQLGVLLLESRDEGELLLDGLLLGERGGLLVQDLLLGPSSDACDLHPIEQK